MSKELTIYDDNKKIEIKQAAWSSLSKESQKAYHSDFKLFFKYINKDAKDVNANDIMTYINYLEEQGYKNNSINRKVASLSKLFRVMVVSGEIKVNPVEVLKELKNINRKVSHGVKISVNMEDVKKAVKLSENHTIQEEKVSLIIRMLTKSGLRISEMINIKNKDIDDFDENVYRIRIVGKGKKERFSYIEKDFYNEIKKIFPNNDKTDYLFYTNRLNAYNRRVLWQLIRTRFFERTGKKVWPHLLRHLFCTYLINEKGKSIKAVSLAAGHSDVSITLSFYDDTALSPEDSKINI